MRVLTIAFLALSTLLAGCAGSETDATLEPSDAFTSEAEFLAGNPVVPLVIKTRPGSVLYQERMWAIKVVEVLADGEPVAGKPALVLFLAVNSRPWTVRSNHFVYDVDITRMLFGDLSPDGGYSLIEYKVPEDVEVLEIKYRFVHHDNTPDERMHILKAYRAG
ncbi:hypothetical protein [Pelagibius sp.]|uniref:hypothetical protein n=1 Tax=Pelagibius sp. TaxID=1931238 RepID=UPI00261A1F96|nr:hypothetical protein [Pelagibius sp.]